MWGCTDWKELAETSEAMDMGPPQQQPCMHWQETEVQRRPGTWLRSHGMLGPGRNLQPPWVLFRHLIRASAPILTRGLILRTHLCPSTFNSILSPNTSLIISGRTLEFLSFHVLSLCGCTCSGIFQETGKLEDQMNVPWGRFPQTPSLLGKVCDRAQTHQIWLFTLHGSV